MAQRTIRHYPARALAAANFALVLLAASGAWADAPLERSRSLSQAFAAQLQSQLQSALAEGGPVAAIEVCKEQAPLIASALSRSSGANVRRTSLRYRNPANAPDEWEAATLRAFDMRTAEGDGGPFEATTGTAAERYRYMSAITAGPLCMVCHGRSLSPEVQRLLDTEYPHDRAIGYEVGDIRGAFSITWPAAVSTSQVDLPLQTDGGSDWSDR